jgi:hypothetical protein
MDHTVLVISIVAIVFIIVIGVLFRFRESVKLTLKAFGVSVSAEGKNSERRSGTKQRSETRVLNAGNKVIASGERSAAVGGNMKGNIATGDQVKK